METSNELEYWSTGGYENSSHKVNDTIVGNGFEDSINHWWALCALLLVPCVAAAENILVCVAIIWNRRLQRGPNYFLISLAVSDCMIAGFVMPFGIIALVWGYFPYSAPFCLFWIVCDVLFCTSSIMHLCAISIDRYLSLQYPFKFGMHKTWRRIKCKIIFAWLLSIWMCIPLIVMYIKMPESFLLNGQCQIPNPDYKFLGSIVCFYVPLVVMIFTYGLSMWILVKQSQNFGTTDSPIRRNIRTTALATDIELATRAPNTLRRQVEVEIIMETSMNRNTTRNSMENKCELNKRGYMCSSNIELSHLSLSWKHPSPIRRCISAHQVGESIDKLIISFDNIPGEHGSSMYAEKGLGGDPSLSNLKGEVSSSNRRHRTQSSFGNTKTVVGTSELGNPSMLLHGDNKLNKKNIHPSSSSLHNLYNYTTSDRMPDTQQNIFNLKKSSRHGRMIKSQRKAIKVLGLVLVLFVILWAPFFVLNLLSVILKIHIPNWLFHLVAWLGYCSAHVNPLLYTMFNKDFRQTFKMIFLCRSRQQGASRTMPGVI